MRWAIIILLLITVARVSGQKDTSFTVTKNPFVNYKYLADPAALVDDGVVYIYAGHDECSELENRYVMNEWCVLSTNDLVHFTEHSFHLQVREFTWARGAAWASQVVRRGDKYYWYVTAVHKTIPGDAIGVAVGDSPTGPFIPEEKALITNDMTTRWTDITWDDIDPTVFVDDDEQAYIFWGNTQLYYARLKPNMTEIDGEVMPVRIPGITMPANAAPYNIRSGDKSFYTEAPWLHKYKERYYLSFSVEFPEKTAYAVSSSPDGPWEYKGIINEIAGNCNTNHHSIFQYRDKWFFLYHNGAINEAGGSSRRSLCLDRLFYKKNGDIETVRMTTDGLW